MHDHNKVVLWRHGQTDWNIANRFQGSTDIPLNETGQSQVIRAGKLLTGLAPTQIIASDLSRAFNTAKALADLVGLEIKKDKRLRETDGGNWEGKTGDVIRETDIENFIRWIDGDDNPAGDTHELPDRRATDPRMEHQPPLGRHPPRLHRLGRGAPARFAAHRAHAGQARRGQAVEAAARGALHQRPGRADGQPGDAAGQGRPQGQPARARPAGGSDQLPPRELIARPG